MAVQIPSLLTTFKLDPEEEDAAKQFVGLNLMHLHNLRAEVVRNKLQLIFDPAKPQHFQQDEAYNKGKLDLLTELIGDNYAAS
jgi:hypothetical protein